MQLEELVTWYSATELQGTKVLQCYLGSLYLGRVSEIHVTKNRGKTRWVPSRYGEQPGVSFPTMDEAQDYLLSSVDQGELLEELLP